MTDMTEINSEISGLKNSFNLDTALASAPAAPKEPEVVTFTPKAEKSTEETV